MGKNRKHRSLVRAADDRWWLHRGEEITEDIRRIRTGRKLKREEKITNAVRDTLAKLKPHPLGTFKDTKEEYKDLL